jgi:DNA-binding NtrC family response regulator
MAAKRESAGHRVRVFDSAAALLESGTLADIHWLISNIDLPKTDGFEPLRRAKAIRPGMPVILITGHSELETRWPPIGAGRCRPS